MIFVDFVMAQEKAMMCVLEKCHSDLSDSAVGHELNRNEPAICAKEDVYTKAQVM